MEGTDLCSVLLLKSLPFGTWFISGLLCLSTVGQNSLASSDTSHCMFAQRLALKLACFVLAAILSWVEALCLVEFGLGITNCLEPPT